MTIGEKYLKLDGMAVERMIIRKLSCKPDGHCKVDPPISRIAAVTRWQGRPYLLAKAAPSQGCPTFRSVPPG
jgi:hypothetical protein